MARVDVHTPEDITSLETQLQESGKLDESKPSALPAETARSGRHDSQNERGNGSDNDASRWRREGSPAEEKSSRQQGDGPDNNESRRQPDHGPSIFDQLAPYPAPMSEAAFYGPAGDFVRLVEGHTEADRNILLLNFLVYFGILIGRGIHAWAGGQQHFTNLFACVVGPTSTGRKGSPSGPLDMFFRQIDRGFVNYCQHSGLSSGEGLIWSVHDAIMKRERPAGRNSSSSGYEEVVADPGITDKRALVKQSEFYGALQVMRRSGNTLSPVIRDAWDGKNIIKSMTKNSPAQATGAHIGIIGEITKEELLLGMMGSEMHNGFANRFLWACSKRSKALPEGGALHKEAQNRLWHGLISRVCAAFNRAKDARAMFRDEEAGDSWGRDANPEVGAYAHLTRERYGLFGAATARAHAQALRLSMIFAALDTSNEIRRVHLDAALEVWRYCEDSAKYIFGDSLGDPAADAILRALREAKEGLTRQEINGLFGGNARAGELQRALLVLHNAGLARFSKEEKEGKGRRAERWFAVWKGCR